MKTNFILTKNTWKTFVHHFNKMLDKKNVVLINGKYTGKQAIKGMLNKNGIGTREARYSFLIPVVHTSPTYFTKDSITYPWLFSPDGQGISMARKGGTFCYIAFGTKMYLTSEKIVWKDRVGVSDNGLTCTLTSSSDLRRAERDIRDDMNYERDLERDYLEDLYNESELNALENESLEW